jgi:hypothetical protein
MARLKNKHTGTQVEVDDETAKALGATTWEAVSDGSDRKHDGRRKSSRKDADD